MSAREHLFNVAADHMPVTSDEVNEAIDDYAHELAEKQRTWARETVGGGAVGAVCLKAIDGAADLIDPEVSCTSGCTCACHAVDPSPCDDCRGVSADARS